MQCSNTEGNNKIHFKPQPVYVAMLKKVEYTDIFWLTTLLF